MPKQNNYVLVDAGISKQISELEQKIEKLLKIQASIVPVEPVFDFLTADQAAALLGYKKSSLYTMVCNEKIPYSKLGKRLSFSRKALSEWIANNQTSNNGNINRV